MANELTTFNVAQLPADFSTEMAEEMDGLQIRYPLVKIPSGGGLAWELPTDDPAKPEITQVLRGVILHNHDANLFYADADSTGTPPDCVSMDGRTGMGEPGGICANCPMNEFGTGKGGVGKACKNKRYIYMAVEGKLLPVLLPMPATSVKAFRDYMTYIYSKGIKPSTVVTEITLKRETSKNSGKDYSTAVFKMGAMLDAESAKACSVMRKNVLAMLNRTPSLEEVKATFGEE